MFYNVLKAKSLADTDLPFKREALMEHGDSSLNVVYLKKGEIIDTHTSLCDAAVIGIEGKFELHFEAQKYEVNEGEILMFKKDKEHKVLALKDSKFFLVKI